MLHEHAKLLSLLKGTGEVVGRKKLQKMVYIAKKMNEPFREKYQFHMYGPYSEELTLRMEEMCQADFIGEVREKKGGYYQYRYEIADKGEEFLEAVRLPEGTVNENLLRRLNESSSKFLELVSTVLYFEHFPKEEIKAKIGKLKARQNYSEEDIEEAFSYIESLRNSH
ncbi:YwgA family protein [Alkalicoccus saliphilus]|uniref:YwgA family protein n=1 Tax=Alkalicoccus saliphilus TaxID=200989 RepID=A0A2T4U4I5_9BACI|nr:hypothetical protein [Alkalicoccus saliphilus]PTL38312.1 hypothetical protein C6Y45_11745 [Alkalicoccus saliphilus]